MKQISQARKWNKREDDLQRFFFSIGDLELTSLTSKKMEPARIGLAAWDLLGSR